MQPRFIRPIHPKTEIRPDPGSIQKILDARWIGQLKIDGHRAQIHISANPNEPIRAFTRQGTFHKHPLSPSICKDLRRLFMPKENWNVIDCEWVKASERLYIFDLLKQEGQTLDHLCYLERWNQIPKDYISPHLKTLGLLRTLSDCMKALEEIQVLVEGLVFKSNSRGFEDSSIVRCRRTRLI